ncbi:MAG: 30S ribosomal protein S3 [Candidatus Paceibacterota bacterium]
MTHIVHPYSHRLGILRDWKSRWFGAKEKYREYLKGDLLIREFLKKRLATMYVSTIEIDRNAKELTVTIESSRPGVIIGRNGEGAAKLKKDIEAMLRRKRVTLDSDLKLDVKEVRSPESNAAIVGQMIREGLEKRMPFRRVMKQTAEKVMANKDVRGVRIELSGRLGGADMSREEKVQQGQIPLQTFRADIDYALVEAWLPYGHLGIKVWIYRGEVFEEDQRTGRSV